MLKLFQGLSRWLANYTSIFVIGVAVFTFFFPHTFDWVRGTTQTVILGIIMLTMGLTLTTNDFKILAQRPLDVSSVPVPSLSSCLVWPTRWFMYGILTLRWRSAFCW